LQEYDITIVGAGPAGSTTAKYAAEAGLRVLLIDKRQELGAPIQCSGAISRHALEENGVNIDDEYVQEAIYGFRVYNEVGAHKTIDYRALKPDDYGTSKGKKPLGYVVDRRRFDRYLMTQAERAGATVLLKTEATGYKVEGNQARLHIRHFNQDSQVRCNVIVGCDGLQSQVGKWAGLQTHIRFNELASCLQYVVDGVETDGLLEIMTGHRWAPGGYGWIFPKGHGYAEVGLGVIRSMTKKNAQDHLDEFISSSYLKDRCADARILEIQGGGVPLASPLKKQYADHVILVGDAARHVNPITGGGLHTALSGGRIASDFLIRHFDQGGSSSADGLKGYQDSWDSELGNKMWKLYETKSDIFREKNIPMQNERLYDTMANYFDPNSEYKKV